MTDNKQQYKKLVYVFLGVLWFFFMLFVGNCVYYTKFAPEEILAAEGTPVFKALVAMSRFRYPGFLDSLIPSHTFSYLRSQIGYSIIYALLAWAFIVYEQKFKHDAEGIEQGSAQWTHNFKDFNKTHNEPFGAETYDDTPGVATENLNNKNTPPVPGCPNMIMSERVRLSTADMKTHVNNNVLVVGGAGTGKSRFFVKPNILQMNTSYVVTDPSGELLNSMHNVLAQNGYKIKVFNLVDMEHSIRYNPFKYIHSSTDVSILVDCFLQNTTAPDQKSGDPFWEKSEKALLAAILFYLHDVADPIYQNFSTVLWMVQQAQLDENKPTSENTPLDDLMFFGYGDENTRKATYKKISHDITSDGTMILKTIDVKADEEHPSGMTYAERVQTSLCTTNYATFKLGGTKTLKSILITAAVRLNPFSNPAVQELTREDHTELDKVGDELTCFFAIIPQTNTTFNFLVSMMFAQMFESLYRIGNERPNPRMPYHVRFILDEFANIGKIPEFPQKISTCRKYNISTSIILQSIAQIKTMYKDDFETIIGNCDTSICLGTNEQTTADYFSKKIGDATIRVRSSSQQIGKGGGSHSYQQTKRELMKADEIMRMPFEKCIVTMNHCDPFYDNKYDVEKHPQYENTGDFSKDNAYLIQKDPAFTITRNENSVKDTIFGELGDSSPAEGSSDLEPQEAENVIKIDTGAASFKVKFDFPDEEMRASAITKTIKKMSEKIIRLRSRKAPYFYMDMEDTEPAVMETAASICAARLLSPGEEFMVICKGYTGDSRIAFIDRKDKAEEEEGGRKSILVDMLSESHGLGAKVHARDSKKGITIYSVDGITGEIADSITQDMLGMN